MASKLKVGPKEEKLRTLREATGDKRDKLKAKAISKLATVKVVKRGVR
jgi:hypothetical protein